MTLLVVGVAFAITLSAAVAIGFGLKGVEVERRLRALERRSALQQVHEQHQLRARTRPGVPR